MSSNEPADDEPLQSFGEFNAEGSAMIVAEVDQLDAVLDQPSTTANQVAELAAIKKAVKKLKAELSVVGKIRKGLPGWNIEALPFSGLMAKHYKQLKVAPQKPVPAVLFTNFLSDLPNHPEHKIVYPVFEEYGASLAEVLSIGNRHIVRQREAGVRIIVDMFIHALIEACHAHAKAVSVFVYVLPELVLSTMSKESTGIDDGPQAKIINDKDKKLTFLNGDVDYAFVCVPTDPYATSRLLVAQDTQIHEVYHLQAANPAIFKGRGRRFFVAEAKGSPTKGAGGNPVTAFVKCVPQVVGQCLAIWKILRMDHIPFVLTSGTHWIFGVLDCSAAHQIGTGGDCVLWHTDPLELSINDPNTIMRPLFLWATQDPSTLRALMEESKKR